MSGHSKWATTKRKKARIDGARAKVFNRIIRELTVAAKLGGSDLDANARLRTAVFKAKAANMPAKNIETAIAKGANELENVQYIEPVYEGYGPGGISVVVECMTDNKTRTVANIRHIFSKHGGNMGEPGSVLWMFKPQGIVTLNKDQISEDKLLELVLEAGVDDLQSDEEEYTLTMPPEQFQAVMETLEKNSLNTNSGEVSKVPDTKTKLEGETAEKAMQLLEALDDDDDVQNVYTNAEFPDEGKDGE